MVGLQGMKSRRLTKVEKPRPLKLSSLGDQSMENILGEMDFVAQQLTSSSWDNKTLYAAVTSLCENLKMFGSQLENMYKEQLDKCYISLRNAVRDDRLSLAARYRLLEIIELRAMHWRPNENLVNYYKLKFSEMESEESSLEEQAEYSGYVPAQVMAPLTGFPSPMYTGQIPAAAAYPTTQPQQIIYSTQQSASLQTQAIPQQSPAPPINLAPGEIIKSSGKYSKPTRIPSKNSCKDEVVIRNADSGKVMGIKGRRVHMIEELSETIISFQRVAPGARERLVQITGPNETNITKARQLIEETIRRNASPVRREDRSLYSNLGGSSSSISSQTSDEIMQGPKRPSLVHSQSVEEPVSEYRYTVNHGNDAIRITGNNLQLVRAAKLVLDEYFNNERNMSNMAQPLTPDRSVFSGSNMSISTASSAPQEDQFSNEGSPRLSPVQPLVPENETPTELPPPKSGQVTVLRQPIIPCSPKDAIEMSAGGDQTSAGSPGNRRVLFAKTTEEDGKASLTSSSSFVGNPVSQPGFYSRKFLVQCASSSHSRLTPQDWASVVRRNPTVVKKGWQYLARLVATANEFGDASINSVPTYLQPNDLVDVSSLLSSDLHLIANKEVPNNEDDENSNNTFV